MTRQTEPGPDAPSVADLPEAPAPTHQLEFTLAPGDVAAIARLPGIVRAGPSRPAALVWHDDTDGSFAASGLALLRDGSAWHLHALEPGHGRDWPPCDPPPTGDAAGQAKTEDPLDVAPPFDVTPVAGFDGKQLEFEAPSIRLTVLDGRLRGIFEDRPSARLHLSGPADALTQMLPALASCRVHVPRASLAAEAFAAAQSRPLPARHLGAPTVAGATALSDGLAGIVAHLLDALLHWVDEFRRDPRPEAVHQSRVAIRRLRSALSLYRRPFPAPELADLGAGLRSCAAKLGEARDWDVFLDDTGDRLSEIGERDARVASMLRAARRRRAQAYASLDVYLSSPEFCQVELAVGSAASLRPWERGADHALTRTPTAVFAAAALSRRMKHVRRRGRVITTLPTAELHELRKDCKRLRYAAEFFAPAFNVRRDVRPFVKRLTALQEELGRLNDAAVAGHLMGQLGRLGRGYAGGVVEGWTAASSAPARRRIEATWKRFKSVSPFWIE